MPVVYSLTNESMPEIIKIGFTDNLPRRLKDLDKTSTPLPFECYYAVEVSDARAIEHLLHEAFNDKIVRERREFFYCTPEQAKSALKIAKVMGGKDVTPTEVLLDREHEGQDKKALANAKNRKNRVDYFGILGINPGEILTFSKDDSITCEVADNGQVIFRGELTTLSGSALTVVSELGYNWQQVRGAGYWCYNDTTLLTLYQQAREG